MRFRRIRGPVSRCRRLDTEERGRELGIEAYVLKGEFRGRLDALIPKLEAWKIDAKAIRGVLVALLLALGVTGGGRPRWRAGL